MVYCFATIWKLQLLKQASAAWKKLCNSAGKCTRTRKCKKAPEACTYTLQKVQASTQGMHVCSAESASKHPRPAHVLCNGKALLSDYPSCPLNSHPGPLLSCCSSTPIEEPHGTESSSSLLGYISLLVAAAEYLVTGELTNSTKEKNWSFQAFLKLGSHSSGPSSYLQCF